MLHQDGGYFKICAQLYEIQMSSGGGSTFKQMERRTENRDPGTAVRNTVISSCFNHHTNVLFWPVFIS